MNLFTSFGIKGISMNQIAGALQISKKTLYEEFANKEKLLSYCMDNEKERVKKILTRGEQEARNPLEMLLTTIHNMNQYKSNYCPAFFKDIQQFDESSEKMNTFMAEQHHKYMQYFKSGIEEGYFIADYKYEAIASLLINNFSNWNTPQQPYIMLAFIRGICTPKGMEALNNYCSPNSYNDKDNKIGIVI